MLDDRYLREKLRDAARAVANSDEPIKSRLRTAFVYGLSSLDSQDFPDDEGRHQFEEIYFALTRTDEAISGAGSMSTTVWLMSDDEAKHVASRIEALAARYP